MAFQNKTFPPQNKERKAFTGLRSFVQRKKSFILKRRYW